VKALLAITCKVRKRGKQVTNGDVDHPWEKDATDEEIHDTVLIAAAFCLYNRYVDGLATWAPTDPALYHENGETAGERLCRVNGRSIGGGGRIVEDVESLEGKRERGPSSSKQQPNTKRRSDVRPE
jgi:hypothetical protein